MHVEFDIAAYAQEARKSQIQFGSSTWNAEREHESDYSEAFRQHSTAEMLESKGAIPTNVQKGLRAVSWQHGFEPTRWESEASRRERSVGSTSVPAKESKNLQKTQFSFGNFRTDYVTDARDGFRDFSRSEMDAVKGNMSEATSKDLRAVHIFAPRAKSAWSSDAMNIGRGAQNCAAPERHTKDLRSSNIYFGAERLRYMSDSRDGLRQFSSRDMDNARGALSDDAKRDLRAVHFILGTDKGVLDRDITDRYPLRRRPRSAVR